MRNSSDACSSVTPRCSRAVRRVSPIPGAAVAGSASSGSEIRSSSIGFELAEIGGLAGARELFAQTARAAVGGGAIAQLPLDLEAHQQHGRRGRPNLEVALQERARLQV